MQSNLTPESRLQPDNSETRRLARHLIARGEVVAFLTDTFYGLGADPFNAAAVRRVKSLKGSDEDKPILVLIADDSQAERFFARRTPLLNLLWQHEELGAVTIIENAKPAVLNELTGKTGKVGLRIPAHPQVRDLLRECGGALTATSANPAGAPPARIAEAVKEYFSSRISLIVDSGAAVSLKPSTIVDISDGTIRLIREGTISADSLTSLFRRHGYNEGVELN